MGQLKGLLQKARNLSHYNTHEASGDARQNRARQLAKVMPEALIRVVARGETGVDHQVDHYERQEAQTELE